MTGIPWDQPGADPLGDIRAFVRDAMTADDAARAVEFAAVQPEQQTVTVPLGVPNLADPADSV